MHTRGGMSFFLTRESKWGASNWRSFVKQALPAWNGGADSRPPPTSAVLLESVKFLLLYVSWQYNCSSGDDSALPLSLPLSSVAKRITVPVSDCRMALRLYCLSWDFKRADFSRVLPAWLWPSWGLVKIQVARNSICCSWQTVIKNASSNWFLNYFGFSNCSVFL